jgi:polysaccharide export outer membrane protein
VLGAVGAPGSYELTSGMRVSDLVFRAGNITPETYLGEAEIMRRVHDPGPEGSYRLLGLKIDLGKALQGLPEHDLRLENFDRLVVRRTVDYFVQVEVRGEVRFPGTFLMPKGSKLADLVRRAGGFTREAFLPGSFFAREEIRRIQEEAQERFLADQKTKLVDLEAEAQAAAQNADAVAKIRESVRLRRQLLDELQKVKPAGRLSIVLSEGAEFEASPENLDLRDGDLLAVPQVPVSVTVHGEVFNPGSVLYTEGKRVEYYINQAGSLKEGADEGRIYVVKADGRAYSRSGGGAFTVRWDAENLRWVRHRLGRMVDRGDIVIVPPRSVVVGDMDLTKDIVDILYKIALSAGVVAGVFVR